MNTFCPECPELFSLNDRWYLIYSWFSEDAATIYRTADSPRGVGIGSIILLPWVQPLIEQGWRTACWALAILMLVLLAPLNLLLRQRPKDLGLLPDGAPPASGSEAASSLSDVVDPAWTAVHWTLSRAVRTARFWWICLGLRPINGIPGFAVS